MPTFTANKSGITFTRAATDVDMKLSTTDTNLWGITNFTVTFKGGTTYSYDESSTDSRAKDYQTVNQESKTSGTTTTLKFTFKNVTINETAKNLYYFKFKADDVRFPDYQIDEWTGSPVVYGMTTYALNNYWIYSPHTEATWSSINSSVPSGWSFVTMDQYRLFSGRSQTNYDDIASYSINFNSLQKQVFNIGRHWSKDGYGGDLSARTLDIYSGFTSSAYGYPHRTEKHYYFYCRPF